MKQEEPKREILTALSMIDRQKRGVITVSELRAKLTRLGEKLSEEEGILQFKDVSNAPPSSYFLPHFPLQSNLGSGASSWEARKDLCQQDIALVTLGEGEKGCVPHPSRPRRAVHQGMAPCRRVPRSTPRAPVSSCRSRTMSLCLHLKHSAHVNQSPQLSPDRHAERGALPEPSRAR